MPVTFDAGALGGNSSTWSHTCSGSDRYLIVGVAHNGTTSPTGVTYGGIALTFLVAVNDPGNGVRSELWGLANPPTGSNTITITWGTTPGQGNGSASFNGVAGVANALGTNGAASPVVSPSVTGNTGDMLTDCVASFASLTVAGGGTQVWNDGGGEGEQYKLCDGTSQTCSWTNASGGWASCVVRLLARGSGLTNVIIPNLQVGPMALRRQARMRPRPIWSVPSTSQVFLQNLFANDVVTTATLQKQTNKVFSVTSSITATLQKQINWLRSVTSSITPILQKQTNKQLSVTVTDTPTLQKQTNKVLSVTVTDTPTLQKQANKALTTTITSTPTLQKQVNKVLSATSTITATLTELKVILVNLLATVVSTATLQKQVNKELDVTVTGTPTLQRQINKALTVTETTTATLVKLTNKPLNTITSVQASLQKQINKELDAPSAITASMIRQTNKALSANSAIQASLQKQVNTTLSATVGITATLLPGRVIQVLLSATVGITSTLDTAYQAAAAFIGPAVWAQRRRRKH